jgi:DNA-binding MarR family transcriptional regulator
MPIARKPPVRIPPASRPRGSADEAEMRPWLAIARTFHLCDALMARRLGALGVRTAEHEVLVNLRRDPGIAQQTLARRCFNAKSHTSALLSALEKRGWVTREADPADARAWKLFLTLAGERMVQKTMVVQAEVAAAMAGSLSARALADMTVSVARIGERLRAMLDGPD